MKLFVYGTLQPGEGLAGWLTDAYVGGPIRATTPGTLYHVMGDGSYGVAYPVALVGPQEPIGGPLVHGTVLTVDESMDCVQGCIRMEQNAGYETVPVVCTLADGSTVEATAFRYRRTPGGARIESGDWLLEVHGECEHDEDDDVLSLHWSEDTYGNEYRVECGCTCAPCSEY